MYEFGPYRLDTQERVLKCNGLPVPLTPKVFDTLLVLVQNNGRIVDKDELIRKIWPDTFVEDGSLTRNICVLRKILGENRDGRQYIETFHKHGYRFYATVREDLDEKQKEELKTIAVLPFKPLSPESSDEYLGLGMADALITRLTNINQITVRPTSSVRKYMGVGQDPVEIGKELFVDSVLEGSILRAGDRIRVTVQFISTKEGRPLWAEKFDEKLTNILSVQDSISEQVARSLMLKLSNEEKSQLTKRHTENNEAYQSYLKGRYHWSKRTVEGVKKGLEYFEQAISKDPNYALAYAGLADCYALLSFYLVIPPKDSFPRAISAAQTALEIDDTLAEAHTSLAQAKTCFQWDWEGAEREYKKAITLNPNDATVHHKYSVYLTALGRHDEALMQIGRALELDPLSIIINHAYASAFYYARHYDSALEQLKNTLEMDPKFLHAQISLGHVYLQMGMHKQAIEELQKALSLSGENSSTIASIGCAYAISGNRAEALKILDELESLSERAYVSAFDIALVFASLGDRESAFEWLQKAFEERYFELVALKVAPELDSLRGDERFEELIKKVGLD
jgi:TolB-like protein/Flp pilus assembly protein TadD